MPKENTFQSLISAMIQAMETNNMILNTYHSEVEPGEKKDCIQYMIETNTKALIQLMEFEHVDHQQSVHLSCSPDVPTEVQQGLANMIAIAMTQPLPDQLVRAYGLLDELKDGVDGNQRETVIKIQSLLNYAR